MKNISKKPKNLFPNIVLIIASLACLFPFILLIMSSLTDNEVLVRNGYSFFPEKFSVSAYEYLINDISTMARAYGVTLFSTAVGTTVGLFMSALLGYGLSFKELPGRRVLNFIVILTLLFNGGLVPTYIIYTHLFSIKNTIWAQIVPSLLMNGFNVIILRSYFANNIPPEVIESSRIDGAKEFTIFRKMILPLSLPILATVGLIIGVMYWNSWMNGLYYITNPKYYNLQNVLNRILLDIRFLTTGFYSDIASDVLAKLPTVSIRMAIAVVGVLPIMVIYPFFQKYFVKGITIGAVKG